MLITEQAFNIKFVRTVRKHPCIYDITLKEYSIRHLVEAAWTAVAREVEDDVKTCKERWKNIRTVFRRNVMMSKDSSFSKKPYYLNEEMQFMMPFLKKFGKSFGSFLAENSDGNSRDDNEDLEESIANESTEDPLNVVEAVMKSQEGKMEPVLVKEEPAEDEEVPDEPPVFKEVRTEDFLKPKKSIYAPPRTLVDKDWDHYDRYRGEAAQEPLKKKLRLDCSCFSDPNQQFLMSLKPDLELMSMEQKRRFKKGVFELLASIMDSDSPSASSAASPSSSR